MDAKVMEQYARLVRMEKAQDDFYRSYAAKKKIPPTAFWILYALRESDSSYSQQDFCGDWFYPKQTVNSAVRYLLKAEYIVLTPVPGTRNRKNMHLTSRGIQYCEAHIDPLICAERTSFARFSEEERETFLLLFEKQLRLLTEQAGTKQQE